MDFVVEPSTSEPVLDPDRDLKRYFTSIGNKPTPDFEFNSSFTPEVPIVHFSTMTVLSATLRSGEELLVVQKSDTYVESMHMCKNPIPVPTGESKDESADGLSSGQDGWSSDSSYHFWNVCGLIFLCLNFLCLLALAFVISHAFVGYHNGLNVSSRHGLVSTNLHPNHQFEHDLSPQDRTDNSYGSTYDVATPHKIPPLVKRLKRFPHRDIPVRDLTSERTDMATCLLTDSPSFHLCPTQPSSHTKSRHADTQTCIHKEFARGNHLEMKSVIATAQYVQRNKPYYAHFDESLIWHTQYYEAYPEREIHILTILFIILHRTSLRNEPNCHTPTSQRNKHRISADLPPDKLPQNNCFRSAETGYEPDSRSLFCHATNSGLPYPTTEHHSDRRHCDTSKDKFTPREDPMCESHDDMDTICCTTPALERLPFDTSTLGTEVRKFDFDQDAGPVRDCVTPIKAALTKQPDSRTVFCHSTDKRLPRPTTEHHSSGLTFDTGKDNFSPKEGTVYESHDTQGDLGTDRGCSTPPALKLLHFDPGEERAINYDRPEYPPVDGSTHSKPDTEPVRGCMTSVATSDTALTKEPDSRSVVCHSIDRSLPHPITEHKNPYDISKDNLTSETFLIKETSTPLHDDVIQERIANYRSEDDELSEQNSCRMRKQWSSSSLLDLSEERLSLADSLPKTPDHTQEQTDGGGGGSGTSCGGGSGSEGRAAGGVSGGSEGGESGQSTGGSGGDGRDNRDKRRRERTPDISTDGESKKPTTPDKEKKKKCRPPDDSQTSDSGYKTKAPSTSNSAPTADHIKQGLTPRNNICLYTAGASMLVYPQPHLQPWLELAEDMQQPKFEPVGELPPAASGLESQPPNGVTSVFEVPNKEHQFSPVSTKVDETQAQNCPPRKRHNPPPPFSNSYPSQEDVPVAPRAGPPEHSSQEKLRIPIKESGKQSGRSVMVYIPPHRLLDSAENHPMSSGGCTLETQGHQKLPYWKLIDGASLVLETPGDDYFPPKTPDDDDPSQGQDRPPRRHHNPPPPFLNFFPHEEVPVAPSPAVAMDDQVCAGAYVLRS